jgi:hypothetical protein
VEQAFGDVRQWGKQALRVPDWNREFWATALVGLIERSTGMRRCHATKNLRLLGTAAASAVPVLLQLAKRDAEDHDFQGAVRLLLKELGMSPDGPRSI